MLEMSALHTNIFLKPFTPPLVNSRIDNVLIRIASELNQPLFQFMNAKDDCLVNTFLHVRQYLIVNWVEVGCSEVTDLAV